jgi:hypothetical protein
MSIAGQRFEYSDLFPAIGDDYRFLQCLPDKFSGVLMQLADRNLFHVPNVIDRAFIANLVGRNGPEISRLVSAALSASICVHLRLVLISAKGKPAK